VLREAPARTVGITGTAGKGTVTRWVTDGLLAAGVDAIAGGNIVPALAAVARPGATLVIELSSFQLERAPGLRPDVAVVLNLGVDHLDRHGDVATYHAAKRALLRELGPARPSSATPTTRRWPPGWRRARPAAAPSRSSAPPTPGGSAPRTNCGSTARRCSRRRPPGRRRAPGRQRPGRRARARRPGRAARRRSPPRWPRSAACPGATPRSGGSATCASSRTRSPPAPVGGGRAAGHRPAGRVDRRRRRQGGRRRRLADDLRGRVALTLGVGRSGPAYAAAAARYAPAEVVAERTGAGALRAAVRRGWERPARRPRGARRRAARPPGRLVRPVPRLRRPRRRVPAAVAELAGDVAAREGVAWTPSS
jgi:UDP-N-acetylmuramoylalanine--D-glutamate ligase